MLLATLTEPVDVRLIDDRGFPWIELLGPLAVVIAGVAGAWFAAQYAGRRLEAELNAADDRLERQFEHEREMRDRDATRGTLDDVAAFITTAIDVLGDYSGAIRHLQQVRRAREAAPTQEERLRHMQEYTQVQEQIIETHLPAANAVMEATAWVFRLQIRFPLGHPVVIAFDDWRQAITEWYEAFEPLAMEPWSPNDEERIDGLAEVASERLAVLLVAARAWVEASGRTDEPDASRLDT